MACNLVWEPDGVLKQFTGLVTADEFIWAVKQVHSDSRFDEARYVICDFSEADAKAVSEQALTEIAALNYGAYASNPNCRIVFVTADAEFSGRIGRTLMSPDLASYSVEVRPSVSDARDWLDTQPQLHLLSDVMGFRLR